MIIRWNLFTGTLNAAQRILPLFRPLASSHLSKRMTSGHHGSEINKENNKQLVSQASVVSICSVSPTVKSLKLHVDDYKEMSYKAGQWIDLMIPQVNKVGGYSMTNSPGSFKQDGILQLVVKFSEHPASSWIHKQCAANDRVFVSFGGNVFYDPKPDDPNHDLLLIGGGIGLNPLLCIVNSVADLNLDKKFDSNKSSRQPGNVCLLYSSSTISELIFKEELDILQKEHSNIHCRYFVTREKTKSEDIIARRLTTCDLEEAFNLVNKQTCHVYVCGPISMLDDIEQKLINLNVGLDQIHIERWD
ncbi:oxidoreductase NAD-binding domain-containing protein 1-like isoform X1 [Argonauta hians]